MALTLTEMHTRISRMLMDTGEEIWPVSILDEAIRQALTAYSLACKKHSTKATRYSYFITVAVAPRLPYAKTVAGTHSANDASSRLLFMVTGTSSSVIFAVILNEFRLAARNAARLILFIKASALSLSKQK